MPEPKAARLCGLLRKLIAQCKADIKNKEETIQRLKSQIEKLRGEQPPNTALVQELSEMVGTFMRELEEDRSQFEVMEQEYNAECPP